MEPLALTFTLAILTGATCSTILGSILALQRKKACGYLINTTGLICFWVAALMPYLHSRRQPEPETPFIESDPMMVKRIAAMPILKVSKDSK